MGKDVNFGKMIHGGDYNPEQWLDSPDILRKDIEYFKKAKIKFPWGFSPGQFWNPVKGSTISAGWKIS